MEIVFQKHPNKPPTLRCVRDDGSETYSAPDANGEFFVKHDLLHFALETTLRSRQAFWGLVAAGRDIQDFGSQTGAKDVLPAEAIKVEEMVGLMQCGAKPSELDGAEYEHVVILWRQLLSRWDETPPGESLSLVFELPSG